MKDNFSLFQYRCWTFIFIFLSHTLGAQKWDTLAPIPEDLTFPVVVAVDGKIHIMGGGGSGGATDHHYAYDPATDNWETKAPVPYKAQQPAGAAANGKIHFFGGGFPNSGTPLNDHYIYDPAADAWAPGADLTSARAIHYGVSLNDVVYTLAGQGKSNVCQAYDAANDAWITKNALPDNFFWYGAHVAAEGHIYRFCGGGYTAPNAFAHRYDPGNDMWVSLPPFPHATHAIKGAAIDKKIYLVGGYYDFLERTEVWIYDTDAGTYTPGTPLPLGRNYQNVVAIGDCIYVLGGNNAIDESVGVQLLRFCPEETSAVRPNLSSIPLQVSFTAEHLAISAPQEIQGPGRITVLNMAGAIVFSREMYMDGGDQPQIWVGPLVPGLYVVQLQTRDNLFVGRISAF